MKKILTMLIISSTAGGLHSSFAADGSIDDIASAAAPQRKNSMANAPATALEKTDAMAEQPVRDLAYAMNSALFKRKASAQHADSTQGGIDPTSDSDAGSAGTCQPAPNPQIAHKKNWKKVAEAERRYVLARQMKY